MKDDDDKPLLPFDAIIAPEILSKRLPSKSDIASCRCVCKLWRSFLSTPSFGRNHLQNHKVTIDDYKLLLIDDTLPPSFPFRTLSLDETLPSFIPNPGPDLDLDSDSDPNPVLVGRPVSIVASLDGLVCLAVSVEDRPYDTLLVFFNPLTLAYKPLPFLDMLSASDPIGFYFANNDYKLVCLVANGHHGAYVYSDILNTWRHVRFSVILPHEPLWWYPPTFYGQCLYFIVRRGVDVEDAPILRFYRIICFDVNTEKFREMPDPPSTVSLVDYHSASLVVLGERELCLYLSYDTSDMKHGVDVWRLDDAVDKWVKVVSYKVEQQQEQHRICTATSRNWVAVLDGFDNSFKKMDREEFITRYRYFASATGEYRLTRGIYAQTLVNPSGATLYRVSEFPPETEKGNLES